jgi:hypothetical protein
MSSLKAAKSKQTDLGSRPKGEEARSALFAAAALGVVSGKVVSLESNGLVLVDYPKNHLGWVQARTLVNELQVGAAVLLAFDGGDHTRPVVLGILYDRVNTEKATLHLKASRIIIEAGEELVMKSGEGSFEARRDGKVNIKGRDVVSRAARTNKVRGSTVLIN